MLQVYKMTWRNVHISLDSEINLFEIENTSHV